MKANTVKQKLIDAIVLTERIVGKKESLPVLSCILIEANNKTLAIRATNLESALEVTVSAEVEEKGAVAVPAAVLSQTVRSLVADSATLKSSDGNLAVESRGSKNLIKAIPHDEFPAFPAREGKGTFSVSRTRLLEGLQAVSYAASPSMIRPELGSVYLAFDGGAAVCVATDSFRLAEKTLRDTSKKGKGEILLPLKHAVELSYVLEHLEEDEVLLAADESELRLEAGGVRFISRVVDAQFPNYKEVIPKKFQTEATVLKGDFAEVLRKARVFSGSEQQVGLHLYPKRKIFTATARSADIGEMSDSVDGALSGDDIDINFHIGYLADCFGSIESDSLQLSFSGPGKPLVIRGVSDASFRYLVMPLNR